MQREGSGAGGRCVRGRAGGGIVTWKGGCNQRLWGGGSYAATLLKCCSRALAAALPPCALFHLPQPPLQLRVLLRNGALDLLCGFLSGQGIATLGAEGHHLCLELLGPFSPLDGLPRGTVQP